jgi:hypothetical protein
MTFVEGEIVPKPVVPQSLRKLPKEKRKKKKKSVMRESEGRFVIQLKTPNLVQLAEAVEEEARLRSTAEVLTALIAHSAEDGADLAAEASSV